MEDKKPSNEVYNATQNADSYKNSELTSSLSVPNFAMKSKFGSFPLKEGRPVSLLVGLFILLFAFIASIVFLFYSAGGSVPNTPNTISENTDDGSSNLDPSEKLQRFDSDLGLKNYSSLDDIKYFYYTAGKVPSGKYSGYKRVIQVEYDENVANGPFARALLYVTNDFKTYIRDISSDPDLSVLKELRAIVSLDDVDGYHPVIINLDDKFALVRSSILVDSSGNLTFSFSDEQEIKGIKAGIKLYEFDSSLLPRIGYGYLNDISQKIGDYVGNNSSVIVGVDPTGLAYTYTLTTRDRADNYWNNKKAYVDAYQKDSNNVRIGDYIKTGIGSLDRSDISSSSVQLYSLYGGPFPAVCAMGSSFGYLTLKNLNDSDFSKIATTGNIVLYSLKDKNHPLYKFQYERKVGPFQGNLEYYKMENEGATSIPSFDEYVSKTPLLFFKDYWGRWNVLGEHEIKLPGGCGKPVVYLYPQTPTEVTVRFTREIDLHTNIPAYNDGWRVLAYPDGSLKNLNHDPSECQKYVKPKFGSEYAYDACVANKYPYIYWTGNAKEGEYPRVEKGWYVSRNDLDSFLRAKLLEVGLNQKEVNDMLKYWVPKLLSKNKKYYRVSFWNTKQMNLIAPMYISPRPDTVYRIFLDWEGLDDLPATPIEPQELEKLERKGFTVVEWGGREY